MTAWYNENDPYAAAWLRNLIAAGHIPAGEVDDRSILDVRADDLVGFDECHWFAGIGGWPLAVQLAGWTGPVWTGSCPCQPLSSAGQRKGHADERHLWPAFQRLIAECRPATVFGEQVASKDGREWLAGVRADLEHLGYAIGCCDIPAAGVGAPHIRQRLFWVAESDGASRRQLRLQPLGRNGAWDAGNAEQPAGERPQEHRQPGARREIRGLGHAGFSGGRRIAGEQPGRGRIAADNGGLGHTDSAREGQVDRVRERQAAECARNPWDAAVWLGCLDGKARRAQPGVFPLADGVPNRVGRLRAYGNAIVPQAAAAFVAAFMATR